MEPLPEHLYEEITAEQLVIDIAALTDLTEDEVRQTGVQNNLVALHLAGNVPEHRQDLQRLAQGETILQWRMLLGLLRLMLLLASMSQMALRSLHLPLHQHWECCLGLSHRLLRVQLCRMNRYLLLPHRVGRMRF